MQALSGQIGVIASVTLGEVERHILYYFHILPVRFHDYSIFFD